MSYSRLHLVVFSHMWTTGFLLVLLLHETLSALTFVPPNQVAVVGDQVTFPCTVNPTAPVSWNSYSLDGRPCDVFTGLALGTCIDQARYNVTPQPIGQYNLSITDTVMSDAGTYWCKDLGTGGAVPASAVYGVMGSEPNVTGCMYEDDQVMLTCSATYNGSNAMPLSMTWTNSSGQIVNSNMTNDTATGLFQSTVYFTDNMSVISGHRCEVTFHAPILNTVPPGVANPLPVQATNAPTYSSVATSSADTVQYCPRNITAEVQDPVATCRVEGGSSNVTTTYTWTNTTNGEILSNSPIVTIPEGDYNLTCTANSTVNCGAGSSKTCGDLTKNISGTAFRPVQPTTESPAPDINPDPYVKMTLNGTANASGIIDGSCSSSFSAEFRKSFEEIISRANNAILNGQLCVGNGQQSVLAGAIQFMTLGAEAKVTFAIAAGINVADTVTIRSIELCAYDVTYFVQTFSNWRQPIIPNVYGCPRISFYPTTFNLSTAEWSCIAL